MANEIEVALGSGLTVYALVYNEAGLVWSVTGSQFVTYIAGNVANYAITCTEDGASNLYVGSFPAAIVVAGSYSVLAFHQAGMTPASSDTLVAEGTIIWNGSSEGVDVPCSQLITQDYGKRPANRKMASQAL